ncbi:MAG: Calx-beta domain-containing protein [Woeseiaceae bacterium]|nr:Calx-beta domain-containing protein [Woeseiaceae bacterium]
MQTKFVKTCYLGLGLFGLLSGCNSGDINFPEWDPKWPSGSTGTIQFRQTTYDAAEGTVVNVGVTRIGGGAGIVRVDYRTVDGSATGGSDYVATSGTLTWPSGTTGNQSISIRLVDDDVAEATESFTIVLSNVSIASLGLNASTTVNIADNDTAAERTFGKITGLDQIVVNGFHYDTDSTNVFINGLPANAPDLKVGQVVTVEGEVNYSEATGTADEIHYYPTLIGPVESADVENGRLVIMGQEVRASNDTVFGNKIDPNTYDGLAATTVVEVSGIADNDGTIDATRIERAISSDRLQLTGDVTALDPARMSFRVNNLMLDYSNATFIDLPAGMPVEGIEVMAVGALSGDTLVVEQLVQAPLAGGAPGE